MKLLKEVIHNQAVNLHGRTVSREAVRGIIRDHHKVLMVYSEKNGDYKFPGGGIEAGESHEAALVREVREEIGFQVLEILQPFGKIIEYDFPLEKEFDVFRMTSYYYRCNVEPLRGSQSLDRYEKELGFIPVWIEIDAAVRKNIYLRDSCALTPRWVRRDLEVLEQLQREITSDHRQSV